MPPPYNVNNLLAKPVYDVAFYGHDIHIPLGTMNLALQEFTWSAINELLVVDADAENYSRLISDIDTLGAMNEGDGVAFDQTVNWLSDMSAFVYKWNLTFAVNCNVTAYSSGAHSVDSVRVIITERLKDGTLVKPVADLKKLTGMQDAGAVENNVVIMSFESNTPFKISQGNIVRIQIILGRTDTGTATSYDGLLPFFYFQKGSTAKTLIESTLNIHLHPALDHAFDVFRDQSLQEGLDYSGVQIDGSARSHLPLGSTV